MLNNYYLLNYKFKIINNKLCNQKLKYKFDNFLLKLKKKKSVKQEYSTNTVSLVSWSQLLGFTRSDCHGPFHLQSLFLTFSLPNPYVSRLQSSVAQDLLSPPIACRSYVFPTHLPLAIASLAVIKQNQRQPIIWGSFFLIGKAPKSADSFSCITSVAYLLCLVL